MRMTRATMVMTVAVLGLASGACAAHHRGWGYQEGRRDAYGIGYDRGYDEGFRHGRSDARHHDSYNFWHSREYRHADRGYRSSYGPRRLYADGFRRGYEQGYREAFDAARRGYRRDGRRPRY